VEDKFQAILNSVTEKVGRSRLEVYGELIDELRRRGLTYRDIAGILAGKCQLQISKSAINDFVRARSRRKRNAARRFATDTLIAAQIASKAASVDSAYKPSEDEVRQRIAAFKARRPVTTPPLDDFHFDPTQPLRLITGGKPASDK
jgi:hypothetical protein